MVDFETALLRLRKSAENFRPEKNNSGCIRQFIQPLSRINLIEWLGNIDYYPKFFWTNRSRSQVWATVGCTFEIATEQFPDFYKAFRKIKDILDISSTGIRFWGGMRFDADSPVSAEWEHLGKYRFVLPAIEIRQDKNSSVLIYNYMSDRKLDPIDYIFDFLSRLESRPVQANQIGNKILLHRDEPGFERWEEMVKESLDCMDNKRFNKIVLARRSLFRFERNIDSFLLLKKLCPAYLNSFCFLFQFNRNFTFLGITPEELYSRSGLHIFCDAIAGTALRGDSDEEDQRLGTELLSSDKNVREHRWVVQALENSLNNLCGRWDKLNEEELLKLTYIQHIVTRFQGNLKSQISDADIIREMHPTPAVAGFPREVSLKYISRLEKFDRGWYAGPVGWLSREEARFAVALRSALINQKEFLTFAGAGIVKGSQSDREWEEIENKLLNYTRLFDKL
jgi:menaquinone-specific isochorismate synthase